MGYEIRRADTRRVPLSVAQRQESGLPPIEPFWPLPRKPGGPSDEEIRRQFAKFETWHYWYELEGNPPLVFPGRQPQPRRSIQRFRHFMPYLVQAQKGSLQGKTVLDIACNSGFWSIQCALHGATVVGFDGRPELIDQANLLRSIVGVENVQFRVMDYWHMSPEALGQTFDIVLNLGILYHLPKPLEALERSVRMAREQVVLDTEVRQGPEAAIALRWEEPRDIKSATTAGIVAIPSRTAIDVMLRHVGVKDWREIPIRTADMPPDYLEQGRASWLITV
jgi:2-polyprenyl-3-methyl-5-hydroxy-6-metoxy-1,4-benzoquinol methylase